MGWGSFRDKFIKESANIVTMGHGQELIDYSTGEHLKDAKDSLSGTVDDISGKTAEDAAKEASKTQAGAMMEQLNYLKEINELPQQYKEQALTRLNEIYGGGEGGQEAQQTMIDQAKASPYYQEIMGGRKAGEEGVMRAASVTGGLRSGNVNEALYDYNTQLQNQALSGSYNQLMGGLQGLAGLPTNEQQIGQTYGDIGTVEAAGITGAAQARQQGTANMINLGLGIGGLLI